MRMWMINPKLMCRKHLLGAHSELHKHRHNFEKRHNISGRVKPPAQIFPSLMESRHNELVEEMERRGYNHKSPYTLPDLSHLTLEERSPDIDLGHNIEDLKNRCSECKKRIEENNVLEL